MVVIMEKPSVANFEKTDAITKTCCEFLGKNGYTNVVIFNILPFRGTGVDKIAKKSFPIDLTNYVDTILKDIAEIKCNPDILFATGNIMDVFTKMIMVNDKIADDLLHSYNMLLSGLINTNKVYLLKGVSTRAKDKISKISNGFGCHFSRHEKFSFCDIEKFREFRFVVDLKLAVV